MYQKGFAVMSFIIITLILSTGIVGGSYYLKKNYLSKPEVSNHINQIPSNIEKPLATPSRPTTIPINEHQIKLESVTESPITMEEKKLSGTDKTYKQSTMIISADIDLPVSGKFAASAHLDNNNLGVSKDGITYNVGFTSFSKGKQKLYFKFEDNGCPTPGLENSFFGDNSSKKMQLKLELSEMVKPPSKDNKIEPLEKVIATSEISPHKKTDFYQHCKEYNSAYFSKL